jgi:flagellar biosynthesis chaperone FliJ
MNQAHSSQATQVNVVEHSPIGEEDFSSLLQKAASELDTALSTLREVEDEIKLFLRDYYDEVGDAFAILEDLNHQIDRLEDKISDAYKSYSDKSVEPAMMQAFRHIQEQPMSIELEGEIKHIYRKLVKQHHPDRAGVSEAQETISHINQAYNQKKLGTLLALDVTQDQAHTVEDLETRYNDIVKATARVKRRTKTLLQSPAYALKMRVLDARLSGNDLIAGIHSHVRHQTEKARKRLMLKKINLKALKKH